MENLTSRERQRPFEKIMCEQRSKYSKKSKLCDLGAKGNKQAVRSKSERRLFQEKQKGQCNSQ